MALVTVVWVKVVGTVVVFLWVALVVVVMVVDVVGAHVHVVVVALRVIDEVHAALDTKASAEMLLTTNKQLQELEISFEKVRDMSKLQEFRAVFDEAQKASETQNQIDEIRSTLGSRASTEELSMTNKRIQEFRAIFDEAQKSNQRFWFEVDDV